MASSGVSQSPLDLFAQCPLCVVTKIIELEGVAFPSSSSFRLTSVLHPKGGRLIDFFYLPFK